MATPDRLPTVLAATGLEAWALRRRLRGVPVRRTGIALRGWGVTPGAGAAILAGLAGGLEGGVEPGTVAIPSVMGLPDGERLECDPIWTAKLREAAARLGYRTVSGPLLTAPQLVTGPARAYWGQRGFVAADMEAGLLLSAGWRVATVRVILDTPAHPIDGSWEQPVRAFLTPRLWMELLWLTERAPRYAFLAARIVQRALEEA